MARVAKRPSQRGQKSKVCEPRGCATYYTDLMNIEGKQGKGDHTPYLIDVTMNTVYTESRAWDGKVAHGSVDTSYENENTKGKATKLEDGINSDNGQFRRAGDHTTKKNGFNRERFDRVKQLEQMAA